MPTQSLGNEHMPSVNGKSPCVEQKKIVKKRMWSEGVTGYTENVTVTKVRKNSDDRDNDKLNREEPQRQPMRRSTAAEKILKKNRNPQLKENTLGTDIAPPGPC
jgi:hypothetical protein